MSFDIDVRIKRGRVRLDYRIGAGPGLTALFGPSGAGKTSLLDAVAGLIRPRDGRIVVAGTVLFDKEQRINQRPEARRCGYVFQDLRLFPHKTVRANLRFGIDQASAGNDHVSWDHTIDLLGIGALLDRMPATLSGGEAQRVAIGRALLSDPRFLLLDEPLSSVDPARKAEIISLIQRIRDELRLPILYVSHDRAEVELLADRIVPINPPPA